MDMWDKYEEGWSLGSNYWSETKRLQTDRPTEMCKAINGPELSL